MRLTQLFTEISHHDPFAKYWNPAEKEIEQQKAAEKEEENWIQPHVDQAKQTEQQAMEMERDLIRRGMDPDDSTLTRVNKEPFETRQFRFQNGLYTAKAYRVDTFDGPEIRVEFYTPTGKICDIQQEAMGVSGIIDGWMEFGNHGPVRRRDDTKF
jgi:hypothetical protein